jgi:hypothetical protein
MATLILGTVGRAVGGPLGGIIGSVVGGMIDSSLLGGGGRPRDVGRIANLMVQSAAYGEPIPIITGRMRAAGNLLWTSGIKESANQSGGGKRGSTTTSTYSYSASFAVGLAARAIVDIGRIWADGRQIRDAEGVFLSPVVMRIHLGSEAQAIDPLIAAAEGIGGAPAYRGIACAVFEDLPLAEYGNRIPNLTFEIIADGGAGHDVAAAIAALAVIDGRSVASVAGSFPSIAGHFAGRSGSVAEAIAALIDMAGASVTSATQVIVSGEGAGHVLIAEADCQARLPGDSRSRERLRRLGGETRLAAVEVAFYDTSRDFQPGLQRAKLGVNGVTDHQSIACAMTPDQAKTLATAALTRSRAGGLRMNVRLPWRYLGLNPGSHVMLAGDDTVWRVREARFETFIVNLELERIESSAPVFVSGDGGRVLAFADEPAGETTLQLLDLPSLPGELPGLPRLWIAASGASIGWRRAAIEVSGDAGASYTMIGSVEGGAVQGVASSCLEAGSTTAWDRFRTVEVALLSDAMWLESRSEISVLAGANLALLGDEIFQFCNADAVSPGRFRLSGLLRGRRGTESSAGMHSVGERFVLLDPATLIAFDPPADALGRTWRARATGVGEGGAPSVSAIAGGRALKPLSPVHLRLVMNAGDVVARWVRRSRSGFGWPDFVDAPLAETSEAYRVDIALDSRVVRSATVVEPAYTYGLADRLADGGGLEVTITVTQLSEAVGPGDPTTRTLILA